MTHYLDTSALVKRYVQESGSSQVRALFAHGRSVAVCRITYAELAATIARLARDGVIDDEARDSIFDRLDEDFAWMSVCDVRSRLLKTVPALVSRVALRGYDAVQLAAALSLKGEGLPLTFWTSDDRLARAASAEGLRTTFLPMA